MVEKTKNTFVIIDGNAIIHRAYHALPPLTTKDGIIVNAVYGFTTMLLKVLNDLQPTYLAVSFDVAGETFRDKMYKEYKAKRVKAEQSLYDQIPLVYKMVQAFGIPIFAKQGFEADDIIATLTNKIRNSKSESKDLKLEIRSIIVTGDLDLLQLVDNNTVEVYLLKKGLSEIELYNESKVKERFGFGPERIVDYKALRGDTSDNIPGVKGIGEKTAKGLIEKIGGVEEIYKEIGNKKLEIEELFSPAVVKKLEQGEDDAWLSKELATVRTDVPDLDFNLADALVKKLNWKDARAMIQKFEFFSLLKRVSDKQLTSKSEISDSETLGTKPGEAIISRAKKKKPLIIVEETSQQAELLRQIKQSSFFVAKEVLSQPDVLTSELIGLVFFVNQQTYFVRQTATTFSAIVRNGVFGSKKILVGHDLKPLVKALVRQGIEVTNQLFDIMIASYVINSSTRAHDFKSIVLRELGKDRSSNDQTSLFGASPQMVAEELKDIDILYQKYRAKLESLDKTGLFQKIEMALIPVLAQMELNGVAIDTPLLQELSKDFTAEIKELTKKIWQEAGEEFNIASSVQLREILFEKMKLSRVGVKKGKTGFSTAASELDKLHDFHPIIPLIEGYRELAKLQNTYVDVLPTLVNKKTGRIHTSFNQAVASTGRLSSSDPNLQNIPNRTELGRKIRQAFVAETGNVLIAADYSQIELRIAASLANDKKMIDIFKQGLDIHQATAAAINNVPLADVTREMRFAAKGINFGILYGMGSYGLSWRASMPQWQAKEFIVKYFSEFSELKKWLDQTLIFAKKEGYVETLFGRRRYIPELKAENFQLRSAGERMAINMPIQGTAADILKLAMINIHENMKIFTHNNNVKLILQVHDELVLEVKKENTHQVAIMIKEEMEKVIKLRVPVEVKVSIGKRWGEMKSETKFDS